MRRITISVPTRKTGELGLQIESNRGQNSPDVLYDTLRDLRAATAVVQSSIHQLKTLKEGSVYESEYRS